MSSHREDEETAVPALNRRQLLGGAAAAAVAGSFAGGAAEASESLESEAKARRPKSRAERAFQVRYDNALYHRRLTPMTQRANGDEDLYPNRIGNYTKGLPHNAFGEVDLTAYGELQHALKTGRPEDFEAITTSGGRRLVNPQAGLAFDLQGVDAHYFAAPPAPALASAQAAGEAVELYWMSQLRDVRFSDFQNHPHVEAACADLNRLTDFRGARQRGLVTPGSLFRDPLPGTMKGPYISQFLWMEAPFGAESVERRIRTRLPGFDFLTRESDWLEAQNGFASSFGNQDPIRRHVMTPRDLAEWVHNDVLFQAYFSAALILGVPRDPFDATGAGLNCPSNPGNPYRASANQYGFATFGDPHRKTLMCEVSTRALKATWFQKWFVHRRLRPEAYAGRVHHQLKSSRYPGVLHADVLNSGVVDRVFSKHGTWLLPMAYPEGSPIHPAYTAGHATVAGACVTILKAMYDESYVIPNPVLPSEDGLTLQIGVYDGPELTVGGELNKLASNVATGRNLAGVHWRSDAMESLRLGEAIAISILRDQKACYNEDFSGFTFTRFDGTKVTI